MKQEKPAALTAGPRHHDQDTPSLTVSTDESHHSEGRGFTYYRLTPRDVLAEAQRIEEARRQKRDWLLALGIPPRGHEDDLTIVRALAAVDRMPRATLADARLFRDEVQRAFGLHSRGRSRSEAA